MDTESEVTPRLALTRYSPTAHDFLRWVLCGIAVGLFWGTYDFLENAWQVTSNLRMATQLGLLLAIAFTVGYGSIFRPLRGTSSPLHAGYAAGTIAVVAVLVHVGVFERGMGIGVTHDPHPLIIFLPFVFAISFGVLTAVLTIFQSVQGALGKGK